MSAFVDAIAAFCERHDLISPDSTIVAAVSGGPDSLCLLHALHQLAPRLRLTLHIAHLDHQLRADSAEDADFVAQIAAQWGLLITIGRADIAAAAREMRAGIEATARAVRLRFLVETALATGASAIALGHTADDQAETVLQRLMRGAGPSGLAAIRPKRPADRDLIPSGHAAPWLIRPLLETTRADVEAYCAEHHLAPRHDLTNDLPIYQRNRVRGYIIPLLKSYNPSIVATLGRTARICAEEDDLLEELTAQAWQTTAVVHVDSVILNRALFAELHPALQRRVLRKAALTLASDIELEAKHIDLLLAAISANRRRMQLPRGLWAYIHRTELKLTRS